MHCLMHPFNFSSGVLGFAKVLRKKPALILTVSLAHPLKVEKHSSQKCCFFFKVFFLAITAQGFVLAKSQLAAGVLVLVWTYSASIAAPSASTTRLVSSLEMCRASARCMSVMVQKDATRWSVDRTGGITGQNLTLDIRTQEMCSAVLLRVTTCN